MDGQRRPDSVVVVGWCPRTRRWLTGGVDPGAGQMPLDGAAAGVVVVDADRLREAGVDQGRIVRAEPTAVAVPRTGEEVAAVVGFCARHRITVTPRGAGHSMSGYGLADGGLSLHTTDLGGVEVVDGHAEVGAGATLRDLLYALHGRGLRPAAGVPGYLGMTVGGLISAGGVTAAYRRGAFVDDVVALQVATCSGELLWCDEDDRPDLFAAALGGLGQVAVITRARLAVTALGGPVSLQVLDYHDPARFFADLLCLAERGEVDELYGLVGPPTAGAPAVYRLHAIGHRGEVVADRLRGLAPGAVHDPATMSYLELATLYDTAIEAALRSGAREFQKPWFDAWLPQTGGPEFIAETVASLRGRDWSATGFVVVHIKARDRFRRPMLRLPEPCLGERWVLLFDILNDSGAVGHDPDFVRCMLERNRRLHDAAAALGGTRYPIGCLNATSQDWLEHYGPGLAALRRAKAAHDPAGVLTPGPGIPYEIGS